MHVLLTTLQDCYQPKVWDSVHKVVAPWKSVNKICESLQQLRSRRMAYLHMSKLLCCCSALLIRPLSCFLRAHVRSLWAVPFQLLGKLGLQAHLFLLYLPQ